MIAAQLHAGLPYTLASRTHELRRGHFNTAPHVYTLLSLPVLCLPGGIPRATQDRRESLRVESSLLAYPSPNPGRTRAFCTCRYPQFEITNLQISPSLARWNRPKLTPQPHSQTEPSVRSVRLIGSWDNFTMCYSMERDSRRGQGQWRGCFAFQNVMDDDGSPHHPKTSGGLKMGHTYFYYVSHKFHFLLSSQCASSSIPAVGAGY